MALHSYIVLMCR